MKYLYTIRIPFEAIDDVGAREKMSDINKQLSFYSNQPESKRKLQEIKDNNPPRKVII